jgi:hypothetical protein
MSQNHARIPGVDAALEQLSLEPVPADVERRLEARLQEFCRQPAPQDVLPTPRRPLHRRFVRASVAAGLAAVVLAALFVAFGNQDAWGQVAKAMRAKPWVRWTFRVPKDMPVPEGFQAPEGWYSAEKKVFAGRANQSIHYIDLAAQETYDYMPRTNTLYRAFPSDIENVEATHFETLLRLVSEWDRALKAPDSPIRIVARTRHDVRDGNRRWTEYTFVCRDTRRTLGDYQVTFRVDPSIPKPSWPWKCGARRNTPTTTPRSSGSTRSTIRKLVRPMSTPWVCPATRRSSIAAAPGPRTVRRSRTFWRRM